MSRRQTTYSKEKYTHLLIRSNLQNPLFQSPKDYEQFLFFLETKQHQFKFQLLGYCLMPDHVHLVIETSSKTNESSIIHGLLVLYSKYYNNKYDHFGSVFGKGYKKELITSGKSLICLLRYLHQKPKFQRISETLHYPYTSYNDYAYPHHSSMINRSYIYRLFDLKDDKKASNLFKCIHHEKEETAILDVSPELTQQVHIAKLILKEELANYKIDYDAIQSNYKFREQLIKKIHEESRLTQQEIADLLNLSRHIVGRDLRLS